MPGPLSYASRISALSVLDPEGVTIGKVADVVIGPARPGRPPPVVGLVVTVPGRRIFVAITRVRRIDAEGVHLASASINLRHFSPRPAEVLVLDGLLDQRLPDGSVVNDVAIAQTGPPARPWELARADLVVGKRLGRRGRRRSESWEVLEPLLGDTRDRWAHLRDLHPVDVAERIADLSEADRTEVVTTLDDEQLADLLEELPEADQAGLIGEITVERAADVLEEMAPDDAADLLAELPAAQRRELLAAMEPEEAADLQRLLRHAPNSAGGLMTPEPVILGPDASVAEALALLREPEIPSVLAGQVFVTEPPHESPTGPLLGVVSLQQLLREVPSTALGDCVDAEEVRQVPPDASDEAVTRMLAAYDMLAVPVCDAAGRLLGAVTVDDALDHILPEGWREISADDRAPRTARRGGGRR
ncbi:magnesium transporter MgtE N-terminal domain-containing protein [Euzebya sp.]|uniref:magnesium transporter MgtE N-terminal domain-containing protein n=1 Tax=Euzebya sp. TaxID=1971409 RepID=UPI003517613A